MKVPSLVGPLVGAMTVALVLGFMPARASGLTPTAIWLQSQNPSPAGETVRFEAVVWTVDGTGSPDGWATVGNVTLFVDGVALSTQPLLPNEATHPCGYMPPCALFDVPFTSSSFYLITATYQDTGGFAPTSQLLEESEGYFRPVPFLIQSVGPPVGGLGTHLAGGDAQGLEGDAGTSLLIFNVTLDAASADTVTVNYFTSNGTATDGSNHVVADYVATRGTLTFPPGVTRQPVAVAILGDTDPEPDETFFMNLQFAYGANIVNGHFVGTVRNDDAAACLQQPQFAVADVTRAEGSGGGTTPFTFQVALTGGTGPTCADVAFHYQTVAGGATSGVDYTAVSEDGVVPAGTVVPSSSFTAIMVNVSADNAFEGNETFTLRLTTPSGTLLASATGTIENDDAPPVTAGEIFNVLFYDGTTGKYDVRAYGGIDCNGFTGSFALGNCSAATLVTSYPVKWGGDEDLEDPKGQAEYRLYRLGDTSIAEKVRTHSNGHHIDVSVLRIGRGASSMDAPENRTKFEWSANQDGSLKELEQKMTVGQGKDKLEVQAKFKDKKTQLTKIKEKVPGSDVTAKRDGLVLLRLATNASQGLRIYVERSAVP